MKAWILFLLPIFQFSIGQQCNDGWELCTSTGECVLSDCKSYSQAMEHSGCGPGQVYCPTREGCVPGCPPEVTPMVCSGEHTYCYSSGTCLPPSACKDTSEATCGKGKRFCFSSGRCQEEACATRKGEMSCPAGNVYCLSSQRCVQDGLCDDLKNGTWTCTDGKVFCARTLSCTITEECFQKLNFPECPIGEIYCMKSGQCTSPEQCSNSQLGNTMPTKQCGIGQVYCMKFKECTLPAHCSNSQLADNRPTKQCRIGQIYCMKSGQCTTPEQCSNSQLGNTMPTKQCEIGLVYCMKFNECRLPAHCSNSQLADNSPTKQCRIGQVYCMSSNQCTLPSQCLSSNNNRFIEQCKAGKVYCMQKNQCTWPAFCGNSQSESGGRVKRCKNGQIFCLERNDCVDIGHCSGERARLAANCNMGEVFCVKQNKCVRIGQCSTEKANLKPKCDMGEVFCVKENKCVKIGQCAQQVDIPICQKGQIFCLHKKRCVYHSECSRSLSNLRCPEGQVFCSLLHVCTPVLLCPHSPAFKVSFARKHEVSCKLGKVYCIASKECSLPGNCDQRPPSTYSMLCPHQHVYCVHTGYCAHISEGCGNIGTTINCPTGEAFCEKSKSCSSTCNKAPSIWQSGLQCPELKGKLQYTSCISSNNCKEYNCCMDAETLHMQCIDRSKTYIEDSLQAACDSLEPSHADTNIECEKPQDCHPLSICCQGKCRSPSNICPFKTLYCSLTDSCVEIGGVCGANCTFGQSFCASSNSCTIPAECEFPTTFVSSAMLSDVIYISKQTGDVIAGDITLSQLFNSDSILLNLQVTNITNKLGAFEVETAGTFVSLVIGQTIKSSQRIRYKAQNENPSFEAAFLEVTEEETGIKRNIVQLLAPMAHKNVKMKMPSLRTIEDVNQMFQLHEIISTEDYEIYEKLRMDAIDAPQKLNGNGLLNKGSLITSKWMDLILNPLKPFPNGLSLRYDEDLPVNSEPSFIVDASIDGEEWFFMPKSGELVMMFPTSDIMDLYLRVRSAPDRSGNFSFIIAPVGDVNNDSKLHVHVEIYGINDAPQPKPFVERKHQHNLINNDRIDVNSIVSSTYKDSDGDALGMAIVYAKSSELGSWHCSTDGGKTFSQITDLADDKILAKLNCPGVCEGVSDFNFIDPISNVTSHVSSIFEAVGEKQFDERFQKLQSTNQAPDLAVNSLFPVLYVPPDAILSFRPSSNDVMWTKGDALTSTPLLYFAWDLSGEDVNKTLHSTNLTFTRQRSDSDSLSGVPTLIHAEILNCDNTEVMLEPKEIDSCGVCGGDDTSCQDCTADITKGSPVCAIKCEKIDCANQCDENVVKEIAGNVMCVVKSEADNFTFCDGSETSGKRLDRCGNCVTEESAEEQANNYLCCTQKCSSQSVAESIQLCGGCPMSTNGGCKALDISSSVLLDVAVQELLSTNNLQSLDLKSIEASNEKISLMTFKACLTGISLEQSYSCYLENVDTEEVIANISSTSLGQNPTFTLPALEKGTWDLVCEIFDDELSIEPSSILRSKSPLRIIDSRDISFSITGPSSFEYGKPNEALLKISNVEPEHLVNSVCLITDPKSNIIKESMLKIHGPEVYACDLSATLSPGVVNISVLLTPALMKYVLREKVVLPWYAIRIMTKSPELVSAVLSTDKSYLTVTFDVNIEETGASCENNFVSPQRLGTSPSCTVKLNQLRLKVGSNAVVASGDDLTISSTNTIVQKAEVSETRATAKGTITILGNEEKMTVPFTLQGSTFVCNSTDAQADVTYDSSKTDISIKVSWTVSWNSAKQQLDKARTLEVWNSVDLLQSIAKDATKTFSYEPNIMLPNIEYSITAQLVDKNGNSISDNKTLSVVKGNDDTFYADIVGSRTVNPAYPAQFLVEVTSCTQNFAQGPVKYFWDINGIINTNFGNEKTIIIPKGLLKGGKTYRLSVLAVQIPSRQVSNTIEIHAEEQGIQAQTATQYLTASASQPIQLDASFSKDLDNMPGELDFMWSCREGFGGCYNSLLQRFENTLTIEILQSASPLLPPNTLVPTKGYELEVVVSKGNRKSSATMILDVVASSIPSVFVETPVTSLSPSTENVIKGYLSSTEGVTARWELVNEPGYATFDLMTQMPFRPEKSDYRPHNLVIPPNSMDHGNKYKFRLVAAYMNSIDEAQATVVIETKMKPSSGFVEITPKDALIGFSTPLNFVSYGWNLEGSITHFGYRYEGSNFVWMRVNRFPTATESFTIPSDGVSKTVNPSVKICNYKNECAFSEGTPLSITWPDEISVEIFENFQKTSKLIEDPISRLRFLNDSYATFYKMFSQHELYLPLYNEVQPLIISKAVQVLDSVTERVLLEAMGINMTEFVGAVLQLASIDAEAILLRKLYQMTSMLYSSPTNEEIKFPETTGTAQTTKPPGSDALVFPDSDERLFDVRNGRSRIKRAPNFMNNKRTHRLQPLSKNSEKVTKAQVEAVLSVTEALVSNPGVTENEQKKASEKLLKDLSKYFSGLCLGMEFGEEPIYINGKTVSFSIRKSPLTNEENKVFILSNTDSNNFVEKTSTMIWGQRLSDYADWKCKGNIQCYGACLVTAQYSSIYSSPVTRVKVPGIMRSFMSYAAILNPETGEVVSDSSTTSPLKYDQQLTSTPEDVDKIKCFGWTSNKWSSSDCETGELSPLKGISCSCLHTGYVGLFETVNPMSLSGARVIDDANDGESPISTIQEEITIYLKIDAPYETTVGNNVDRFISNVKPQFAAKWGIPVSAITNIVVYPGSVMMDITIAQNTGQRISGTDASIDDIAAKLYDEIDKGFYLTGLNLEKLKVDKQTSTLERNDLPILIGGIVGGVLLCVLVLVFLGLYIRNKSQREKVRPLNTQTPTYRKMNFEKNLDGTAPSITGKSDNNDGFFRERLVTPPSRDSGISSPDLWGKDVPPPSKYKPPSKKQLESSQPIPEHILEKIHNSSRSLLPGSPEDPIEVAHRW